MMGREIEQKWNFLFVLQKYNLQYLFVTTVIVRFYLDNVLRLYYSRISTYRYFYGKSMKI